MDKMIWYLKQLLPLRYTTTIKRGDEKVLSIWRMWFGICFDIKEYILKG